MVVVVVLTGLPGAGKTTLARRLAAARPTQVVHVEYDALAQPRKQVLEEVFAQSEARDPATVMVLDDNFYYASMRHDVCVRAHARGWAFVQVFVDAPVQVAHERNVHRGAPATVPAHVIDDMAAKFDRPQPSLRPWEAPTVVVDPHTEPGVDDVLERITAAAAADLERLATAEQQRMAAERDREAVASSLVHQLDLRLRRATSDLVTRFRSTHPRPDISSADYVRRLADARRDILARARTGTLPIPCEVANVDTVCEWASAQLAAL